VGEEQRIPGRGEDVPDVVERLWGFCHTLRNDGIDYGDTIEQIAYLLFLKMAEERGLVPPRKHEWRDLRYLSGNIPVDPYMDLLRGLGK
jgi:type I restriction enzyme M protein